MDATFVLGKLIAGTPIVQTARVDSETQTRTIETGFLQEALVHLIVLGLCHTRREGDNVPDGLTVQFVGRDWLRAQVYLKKDDTKARLSVFADGSFDLSIVNLDDEAAEMDAAPTSARPATE